MKSYIFYTAVLILAASCGGSRVTNVWKSADVPPPTYNKIMVVGLIRDSDHALQDRLEAHFVGDLESLGYNAVSAWKLYGPKAFEGLKEQEAINKISSSGADAVITIVLLDKSKERYYVPGRIQYSPYFIHSNNFWGYYNTMYGRILEPGYYQENTKYFLESNLYDTRSNKLVYSVQTQSFDPATAETLGHQYGQLIVKEMVKDQVLVRHVQPLSVK
jgi:hypothetical protein